ncbi:MAG: adenosylcobalamin-dependent ribonucleoside-diphosphate reductase, partial [Synergistaceae bacterium]|nr:adenosylcobalamin-dependent ribonucleoside-diphosphate reductase [Synergistaceae bacterium]
MNNNYGFSDTAVTVLKERYMHVKPDGSHETIPEMFSRVANYLSEDKAQEYYQVMMSRDFLPNSPTLMNAGRAGMAAQLSACYVLPIEDSMDSITDAIKYQMIIHKYGGGTGFNFSELRPKGAPVKSVNGKASGPVGFMELLDFCTETVMQGGARRGANMGILNVDHPDILEFISCKASDTKRLNNFNISVGMNDDFMGKVENRTLNEQEREIWNAIIDCAWKNGDPGLVFFDEINRHNTTPELGELTATNPCGESPLLPFESCNLGSINLAHFITYNGQGEYFNGRGIDWPGLERVTCIAVEMLNDVIDKNHYPIPEVTEAVNLTRKIGLGVMGWADMLCKLGIKYGSPESLKLAEKVMSFIQKVGHKQSAGRNACVTCIAPTGTISLIAGCSSGVEPHFALEYDRIAFDKENRTILHYVNEDYEEAIVNHDERLDNNVFVTAHEINYLEHIDMQAAFQKYVDLAVSKTINLPNEATKQDVERAYLYAWIKNCK